VSRRAEFQPQGELKLLVCSASPAIALRNRSGRCCSTEFRCPAALLEVNVKFREPGLSIERTPRNITRSPTGEESFLREFDAPAHQARMARPPEGGTVPNKTLRCSTTPNEKMAPSSPRLDQDRRASPSGFGSNGEPVKRRSFTRSSAYDGLFIRET